MFKPESVEATYFVQMLLESELASPLIVAMLFISNSLSTFVSVSDWSFVPILVGCGVCVCVKYETLTQFPKSTIQENTVREMTLHPLTVFWKEEGHSCSTAYTAAWDQISTNKFNSTLCLLLRALRNF